MLEKYLGKGMAAGWLPRHEGGTNGTGGECTVGTQDVKGGEGIYLPFVPKGINFVESQGKDVVSFNFSGCIMAVYTVNGSRRVCHVSTGSQQDCKEAWNKIKANAKNVKEFKPHEHVDVNALQKTNGFMGCYGLITSNDDCYAITVAGDSKVIVSVGIKAV